MRVTRIASIVVCLTLWGKAVAISGGGPVAVAPAAVDRSAYIGVNNLQMLVSNVGSFAFDPTNRFGSDAGLYFPRGTDKTVIFAGGIWVGARVNGQPRVSVAEYTQEFRPGTADNGTYEPDQSRFRVYKIARGDDAESNSDYANWPFDDGAPAVQDANGNDSLDADGNRIPLIYGDETLYAVYHDLNAGAHTNQAGSTQPLGLEIQQSVFAFSRSGALGNAIFLKFVLINEGSNLLEDTYVSLWCDPDVGDAFDDLVGCDTNLMLGYAYNEGPDPIYGVGAPAVGYDFLQGPIVPSPGDSARYRNRWVSGYRNLPMTSFNLYTAGKDPTNSQETYNYMQGLTPAGDTVYDPSNTPTTYQVAGDPVTGQGWVDVAGNDRRFMMTTGPFTMAVGDTQEVVIAVLVGQGADHLSSISALRQISEQAQAVFDLGFNIPSPPPQPRVWQQPLPNRIELVWDHAAEGDVQESSILGQRFVMEGYNVYQGESQAGPWTKIATYDVDNDITRIYKDVYDPAVGAIQRVIDQLGTNSGLQNHLTITTDRLTGEPLVNYRPYYFAVTAYSYDEANVSEYMVGTSVIGHLTEVLETQIQSVEVVPNSVALELVDTAAHVEGSSRGQVVVRYFEPENVTGDTYEVTFNDDLTWNLINTTTGQTVLSGQENQTGDYDYEIVDGVMVQTMGPEPGLETVSWYDPNPSAEPWATSVNIGGPWFGGGFVPGAWFFGSSITDMRDLIPVEIRFSNTETQLGYQYLRGADPNYSYHGYSEVPLTAWDVSVDPPRQLNVCFVEQFGLASADGRWLPEDDPISAREYLFILNSDYSDTPDDYYTSRLILDDAADFDVLYAWWPAVAEGHSNTELADGQILRVEAGYYNKPEDRFVFSTLAGGDDVIGAGAARLDDVHPVPNPYFHATDLEMNASSRQIEFVGLPATDVTLEIYTLAGELIRTLTKDDIQASTLTWDVKTENGLPPASGIYIYRVVAPGVGSKVGKLAVFTEVEQVQRY
ncbi:MAG: hypothetical protein Kow0074_01150 [Candidatus Zixiibacteriota bacterium]